MEPHQRLDETLPHQLISSSNPLPMGQNEKKHRINSHQINHCPLSLGVSEVSERVTAAERASEVSSAE